GPGGGPRTHGGALRVGRGLPRPRPAGRGQDGRPVQRRRVRARHRARARAAHPARGALSDDVSGTSALLPPAAPRVSDGPPGGGPVLVVAPHPDDESLGPGGTLALHVDAGHAVHALFLTSGVHGAPGGAADPQAYVDTRRAEAEAA